jgi:hypothetical protein
MTSAWWLLLVFVDSKRELDPVNRERSIGE